MRRRHHLWGPVRIQFELKKAASIRRATWRSIERWCAAGSSKRARSAKKVLKEFTRWERGRPMELWQMDVVGSIFTTDGTEAKILTGIDDHSRFIVRSGVMARATARPVCEHFVGALERWGVPEEILTDNGKVFTGRFGRTTPRCSLTRSAERTGSPIASPRPGPPHHHRQDRTMALHAASTSSWVRTLFLSRGPSGDAQRLGRTTTTPGDPTSSWAWPHHSSASVDAHSQLTAPRTPYALRRRMGEPNGRLNGVIAVSEAGACRA